MAPPRKKIDPEQLKQLAERGWNDKEIAAFFGVHSGTLHKRYSDQIDRHRLLRSGKHKDISHAAIQTLAQYLNPQKPISDQTRISAAGKLMKLGSEVTIKIPAGDDGNGTFEKLMGICKEIEKEE